MVCICHENQITQCSSAFSSRLSKFRKPIVEGEE
jgi:hypothetical protein